MKNNHPGAMLPLARLALAVADTVKKLTPRIARESLGRSRSGSALSGCVLAGAGLMIGLSVGGCSSFDPPPFSAHDVQQPERSSAAENTTPEFRPLPTTMESPFLLPPRQGTTGPVSRRPATLPTTQQIIGAEPNMPKVRMTLQELLHLAAANSLDVRVASYQPAIDADRITEAEARFDLHYYAQFQYQDEQIVNPSPAEPTLDPLSTPIHFSVGSLETGLKQTTDLGTQLQLGYSMNYASRSQNPPLTGLVNPFYYNDLTLQVTQPLLQNFGTVINRARIDLARDTQKISLLDFRLALEKNVADIEEAYWNLAQAEREVQIQEQLLAQTVNMTNLLDRRMGTAGTGPVEVQQAAAQVAARRATLIQARSDVIKYSDQLKLLVNDPSMPVSSSVVIVAADPPVDQPIQMDINELIQTALTNRAELAEQQLKVDSAEVTRQAAKNNLLPSLSLQASTTLEGDSSTIWGAFQKPGNGINWSIGLQLDVPIGNREARSIYHRTLLQRQAAVDQYKKLTEQIAGEVKTAQRDLFTAWEGLARNREARYEAEDALRELEQREPTIQIDPSYVNTKLQLQENVAQQQRLEEEALVKYNIAISALERAKGTILRYNNIIMAEQSTPYGQPGR